MFGIWLPIALRSGRLERLETSKAQTTEKEQRNALGSSAAMSGNPDGHMNSDQLSLDRLYSTYRQRLVWLAVQFVDDKQSAEDVVQDVFARLARMETLGQSVYMEHVVSYLRTAVLNECRSVLRRRQRRRGVRWSRSEQAGAGIEEQASVFQEVLKLIDRLPPRQKEVIVLRYFEELTVGEVAEALGISSGAVSASASTALRSIALHLKGS